MEKELIIELKVDEEEGTGINTISFVESPAIEVDFLYFNENKEVYQFKDEEKRIVVGPAMIPNEKIIRMDGNGEPYFVFFSEETIQKCAELYFKNSNHTTTNVDHEKNLMDGVTVMESWIVENPDYDKSKSLGFKDVKKGTWFVSYKVENEELWQKVKNGEVLGFSVEGMFGQEIKQDNAFNELKEILNSCMSESEMYREIRKKINKYK